jgi:hypothetical protein
LAYAFSNIETQSSLPFWLVANAGLPGDSHGIQSSTTTGTQSPYKEIAKQNVDKNMITKTITTITKQEAVLLNMSVS